MQSEGVMRERDAACDQQCLAEATSACLHAQVLFRHGARTPLTRKYWEGSVWDGCGDAFGHAVAALRGVKDRGSRVDLPRMKVFDKHTQQRQESYIDGENLVHYPGGCTRGELTKVGQRQVCSISWRPYAVQQLYISTPLTASRPLCALQGLSMTELSRLSR